MAKSPARRSSRSIDKQVQKTYSDLQNRFEFVAKARANIWVTAAVVLFVIGFIVGAAYLADPQAFLAGSLEGTQSDAAFLSGGLNPTQSTISNVPTTITPGTPITPVNGGGGTTPNPSVCTRRPAKVEVLSPLTVPSIKNGDKVAFTVKVTNQDSTACGQAAFVLSHAPTGALSEKFNFYDYKFVHILSPGASSTAVIQVSPYNAVAKSNLSYLFTTMHSVTTSTQTQYLDCNLIGNNTVNGGPATTSKINLLGGPTPSVARSIIVHSPGCNTRVQDPANGTTDTGTPGATIDTGGTTIPTGVSSTGSSATKTSPTPTTPTKPGDEVTPVRQPTSFWRDLIGKYLSGGFVPSTK